MSLLVSIVLQQVLQDSSITEHCFNSPLPPLWLLETYRSKKNIQSLEVSFFKGPDSVTSQRSHGLCGRLNANTKPSVLESLITIVQNIPFCFKHENPTLCTFPPVRGDFLKTMCVLTVHAGRGGQRIPAVLNYFCFL